MEALAALSLACNVVTLVDFGLKIASECRQIYKHGTTIQQQDFMSKTQDLLSISGSLEKTIVGSQTSQPLTRGDTELLNVAKKCQSLATELQKELHEAAKRPPGSSKSSFTGAYRLRRRAGKVENIMTRLLECQKLLETRILVNLHEKSCVIVFKQKERFDRLQSDLRHFVSQLTRGFANLTDLTIREADHTRRHITSENDITREHVTKAVQNLESQIKHPLLENLKFPEIDFRQQQIADAYHDTFEFIFDDSGEQLGVWSNFVDWLRSDDTLYWIIGKAGSGKSTLMNFICCDERLKSYLCQAKRQRDSTSMPLVLTFFFWNAGNFMQKSARGLLQSLLYQIFDQDPTILQAVLSSRPSLQDVAPHNVWRLQQLKDLLKATIMVSYRKFCILIDGLDEFDEDVLELLDLLNSLKQLPNVKICVSSRPQREFEVDFGGLAGLRLQDLTRESISKYVNRRLIDDERVERLLDQKTDRSVYLVETILDRASGVFLWVTLVVKDLLDGVYNEDDWEKMLQRLEACPGKVEEIYERMWKRYQGDLQLYKEDAAYYFRLILFRELSLLQFSISVNKTLQKVFQISTSHVEESEIVSMCKRTRAHVTTRTSGLLEIEGKKANEPCVEPFYNAEESTIRELHTTTHVQFFHRTARDFVYEALRKDFCDMHSKVNLELDIDLVPVTTRSRCIIWLLDPNPEKRMSIIRELEINLGSIGYDQAAGSRLTAVRIGEVVRESLILIEQIFARIEEGRKHEDGRRWDPYNISGWDPIARSGTDISCDVLGVAIEEGFGNHVTPLLADSSRNIPMYLTYLLGCATSVFFETSPAQLMCALLEAGADPMGNPASYAVNSGLLSCVGTAPWHLFLREWWRSNFDGTVGSMDLQVVEVTRNFLAHGADMVQRIPLAFGISRRYGTAHWKPHILLELFDSDESIIVMTNAASILKRSLAEEVWSAMLNDDQTLSNVEDCFEAVLLLQGDIWRRVSCLEDSKHLIDQMYRTCRGKDSGRSKKFEPFEDDNLPEGYPPEIAQLLRMKAEVWNRGIAFAAGSRSDELKIPGWSRRMTRDIIQTLGAYTFDNEDNIIKKFSIPHQLLADYQSDSEGTDPSTQTVECEEDE
ncbi:MAG: hypothetical protein L6R40_002077 [Gallowayella cf. fulva]|nr:MAG: hypothetical protein L6R40_002077 [Xanthomendoza cf. fulva]